MIVEKVKKKYCSDYFVTKCLLFLKRKLDNFVNLEFATYFASFLIILISHILLNCYV